MMPASYVQPGRALVVGRGSNTADPADFQGAEELVEIVSIQAKLNDL